jgi:hypothetical protein
MEIRARNPRGLEAICSKVPVSVSRYGATPRFSKYTGMPSLHLVLAQPHARSGSVGGNEKRVISGQEFSCRSRANHSRRKDSDSMWLDLLLQRCRERRSSHYRATQAADYTNLGQQNISFGQRLDDKRHLSSSLTPCAIMKDLSVTKKTHLHILYCATHPCRPVTGNLRFPIHQAIPFLKVQGGKGSCSART